MLFFFCSLWVGQVAVTSHNTLCCERILKLLFAENYNLARRQLKQSSKATGLHGMLCQRLISGIDVVHGPQKMEWEVVPHSLWLLGRVPVISRVPCFRCLFFLQFGSAFRCLLFVEKIGQIRCLLLRHAEIRFILGLCPSNTTYFNVFIHVANSVSIGLL